MENDADYLALLLAEFGAITPENATKWGSLQPAENVWDFSVAENMVALAETHSLRVKGHTLVWHNQLPSWVSEHGCRRVSRHEGAHHRDTA